VLRTGAIDNDSASAPLTVRTTEIEFTRKQARLPTGFSTAREMIENWQK
jgi:hypothetical protein